MARTLRVSLLAVRVQVSWVLRCGWACIGCQWHTSNESLACVRFANILQQARRYHVTFQALAAGQAPMGVVLLPDSQGLQSDQPEVGVNQ